MHEFQTKLKITLRRIPIKKQFMKTDKSVFLFGILESFLFLYIMEKFSPLPLHLGKLFQRIWGKIAKIHILEKKKKTEF